MDLDAQNDVSVYDFLYHDARRVASFISQFDTYGAPQQLKRTETANRSKTSGSHMEAEGGVPKLAKALGSLDNEIQVGTSRSLDRTYDPLWTNAITLLDYLDERELIVRSLREARLGQFVLVSGSPDVRDLRLIQKFLATPALQAQLQSSNNPPPNRQERRSKPGQQPRQNNPSSMVTDFFNLLPHAVQAQMHSEEGTAWCMLEEDAMVVSSADLFLKHGVRVPGLWHMLGVLDAVPSNTFMSPAQAFAAAQIALPKGGDDIPIKLVTQGMGSFIDAMVPFARMLLGRRDSEFGVTPLLIFREVDE